MPPDAPPWPGERSCRGELLHARTAPVRHAFRYRVWMLLVDADRIEHRRWGCLPVSVDRGHLLDRSAIGAHLDRAGIDARAERIFALTQPRALAPSFNPVNFYFCYDGAECAAILCDVRSTPWNETHCYALDARGGRRDFSPAKRLHVSPFLPMRGRYRWRFEVDGRRIRIAMRFDAGAAHALRAVLSLRCQPLTRRAVLGGALRHPAQNAATAARIYWQAGRLRLKRAPFHAHPRAPG